MYNCKPFFTYIYIYGVISCDGAEKDIRRPDYEPVVNILTIFVIYSISVTVAHFWEWSWWHLLVKMKKRTLKLSLSLCGQVSVALLYPVQSQLSSGAGCSNFTPRGKWCFLQLSWWSEVLFRMCKSSKFWPNVMCAIRDCSLERAGEGQTCINELWKVLSCECCRVAASSSEWRFLHGGLVFSD